MIKGVALVAVVVVGAAKPSRAKVSAEAAYVIFMIVVVVQKSPLSKVCLYTPLLRNIGHGICL